MVSHACHRVPGGRSCWNLLVAHLLLCVVRLSGQCTGEAPLNRHPENVPQWWRLSYQYCPVPLAPDTAAPTRTDPVAWLDGGMRHGALGLRQSMSGGRSSRLAELVIRWHMCSRGVFEKREDEGILVFQCRRGVISLETPPDVSHGYLENLVTT
jgi:hypothetical protein